MGQCSGEKQNRGQSPGFAFAGEPINFATANEWHGHGVLALFRNSQPNRVGNEARDCDASKPTRAWCGSKLFGESLPESAALSHATNLSTCSGNLRVTLRRSC